MPTDVPVPTDVPPTLGLAMDGGDSAFAACAGGNGGDVDDEMTVVTGCGGWGGDCMDGAGGTADEATLTGETNDGGEVAPFSGWLLGPLLGTAGAGE